MRLPSLLLIATLIALPVPRLAFAQAAPSGPPTVAEAQAFMERAEADLLDLANEAQRAAWLQETNITEDTEAIAAKAAERDLLRTNEIVIAARRFDKLTVPPDLARKFMLLRLNGSPTDPKLVA